MSINPFDGLGPMTNSPDSRVLLGECIHGTYRTHCRLLLWSHGMTDD